MQNLNNQTQTNSRQAIFDRLFAEKMILNTPIIKVKRGTSVSLICMSTGKQSPNTFLPFEINGAFDYEISKCSCCDEKTVHIFNVVDDEDIVINVDLTDVEIN